MNENLTDLVLELCSEVAPLDADAMRCIDQQPPQVRAACALVLFAGLTRAQKIDVARRAEAIEAVMNWLKKGGERAA